MDWLSVGRLLVGGLGIRRRFGNKGGWEALKCAYN